MARVDIVLSENFLQYGVTRYLTWDTEKAPHMAISGITGTGKTYLVKLILGKVSLTIPDAEITVCDFKGDSDFAFLTGCKRFYRYEECRNGLDAFYEGFRERQRHPDSHSFRLLLFDEWAGYCNYLEKKESEEEKKKLASLLLLGRSFNYHVLLSQQRMDAEYFGKSRDNFNLMIYLGNPSKEVKEMLFSDYKDELGTPDRTRGTGYMLTNGTDFQRIIVPEITKIDKLHNCIRQAVLRGQEAEDGGAEP